MQTKALTSTLERSTLTKMAESIRRFISTWHSKGLTHTGRNISQQLALIISL